MSRNPKFMKMLRQRRLQPRWLGDKSLEHGIEIGRRETLGMYAARARGLVSAKDGFDAFHKKLYKLMGDAWYEEYFGIDPEWSHNYTAWVKTHGPKLWLLKDWSEDQFVFLAGNRDALYRVVLFWNGPEYWIVEISARGIRRSVSYASSDLAKWYWRNKEVMWDKEAECCIVVHDAHQGNK